MNIGTNNTSDPFSSNRILTVSQLTEQLRELLETSFSMVWVTGEISNLRVPASGHAYFNLKDAQALIQAVMFRGQQQRLKFRLQDGLTVTGLGRLSVYAPRGNYQIIFEFIEPKGAGALQLAYEQLKKRLTEKGLFDQSHKKPLPFLPKRVALITSASGAVLRDMLYVARKRFEQIPILLIPTAVQGDQAPQQIVRAIQVADRETDCDVAILARGGGSLEDLQAFNDEAVAQAIFDAEIPIVSAVGHETDYTIADFVADQRAPTPTAAAEMVFADKNALLDRLENLQNRIIIFQRQTFKTARQEINLLKNRLKSPLRDIDRRRLRLDELNQRLILHVDRNRYRTKDKLEAWCQRLLLQSPVEKFKKHKQELEINRYNLLLNIKNIIATQRTRLMLAKRGLAAYGPQKVLARGYSITRHIETKEVITDARQVEKQTPVEIILHKGTLKSIVSDRSLEDGQTKDI